MKNVNWSELRLTKKSILLVDVYYYSLMIIALMAAIWTLISTWKSEELSNQDEIMRYALYGCIAMSVLGCSCYYVRKIYKLKLAGKLLYPTGEQGEELKLMGALSYFISRPLYSITFSIVSIIGIKCGLIDFSLEQAEISSSFIEVTMFIGFFIGFETGKFLNLVENKAEDIMDIEIKDNSFR